MLEIINKMSKELYKILLPIIGIEFIFRILINIKENNAQIIMLHAIWVMLAAFFLIIYTLQDGYRFIFSREQFFYYTTKYKITTILFFKTMVNIIINFIFFLTYTQNLNGDLFYKLLSITSFYVINLTILLIVKTIITKKSRVIYTILIASFIFAVAFIFMYYFRQFMPHYMLGANNISSSKQIYLTILPLTLFGQLHEFQKILFSSAIMNTTFTILGLIIFSFLKNAKINW